MRGCAGATRSLSMCWPFHTCSGLGKIPSVLVEKGDENQCVFDHAHALSVGKTVPLTLKSHPGIAICRQRYHWVHQDAKQVRGFAFKRMDT